MNVPEQKVVEAVEEYLRNPSFETFSTRREYPIQKFSTKGRADVVLLDRRGKIVAIVECKRDGYTGDGHDQLKNYLDFAAGRPRFGVFANNQTPDLWEFYERKGSNPLGKKLSRIEFEKRVNSLLNYFRRYFQKPAEANNVGGDQDPKPFLPPKEIENVPIEVPKEDVIEMNEIDILGKSNPNGNSSLPDDLNELKKYGFLCASQKLGNVTCLPEHIEQIIRDKKFQVPGENIVIAEDHPLNTRIAELEEEKARHEQKIVQNERKCAKIEAELAEGEAELGNLTDPETGFSEGNTSEIKALKKQLAHLNISEALEVPVSVFPDSDTLLKIQQDDSESIPSKGSLSKVKNAFKWLIQWFKWGWIEYCINQLFRKMLSPLARICFLIVVFCFLWFFYVAVASRIFPREGQEIAKSANIFNPLAYQEAMEYANWLVLLFPIIFFCLAILVHYYWGKWKWLVLILGFIALFDIIVALVSSVKVHEYLIDNVRYTAEQSPTWPWNYLPHISIVILCGFGVSLVAGFLYHALMDPHNMSAPEMELAVAKRKLIADVREPLEVELARVEGESAEAHGEIKKTLEMRIARLEADIQRLQALKSKREGKVDQIQTEIKNIESQKAELQKSSQRMRIDRNKLEEAVYVFLDGWDQYLMQSGAEADEADTARKAALDTVDAYFNQSTLHVDVGG